MRTPEDLARQLGKVQDVLDVAVRHHVAKCESNAALHLSPVRPDPLTAALQGAAQDLARLREELTE